MLNREGIIAVALFALVTVLAFWQFLVNGKIPIAGDAILGTYYPWIDRKWEGRETIFPVLNPTISDSVTSFYPWKYKAISDIKQGIFPLLDNSSYMGNPLFATGTTGALYPLNVLFLLLSFNQTWGLLALLAPFLGAIFFYLWLRSKELHPVAATIAGISYAFSAFIGLQATFVNSPHAVIWLPLVLLCIDRLLQRLQIGYFLLVVFAIFSSFNAGFFQGSLYLVVFSFLYFLYSAFTSKVSIRRMAAVTLGFIFPVLLSAIQIIPFIELVRQSSRVASYGGSPVQSEVFQFFVQFKYLITTFVPDFFGNPGKWNYWGEPNYYEFNNFVGSVSMIGVLAVVLAWRKSKGLAFFTVALAVSLVLATPNFISQFPYYHSWPVLFSLVPARILLITQFCLLTLSAYGLSIIFERRLSLRQVVAVILGSTAVNVFLLIAAMLGQLDKLSFFPVSLSSWEIAFRNSLLPAAVVVLAGLTILVFYKTKKHFLLYALVILAAAQILYQTKYFRPFIAPELLYPKTPVISYLQENSSGFRYMITDHDLLPSNLQTIYGLESVDGAGPLFPENYNRMMGGLNFADSKEEFPHFPRTINFANYKSSAINLLSIKYVLSLEEINNPALKLILQDGKTSVYENTKVLPRVWIAEKPRVATSPAEALKILKSPEFDSRSEVVVTEALPQGSDFSAGKKEISALESTDQSVSLNTYGDGILVFSEQFYPGWKGFIDDKEVKVFPVNSDLIGLVLPPGEHRVKLLYSPESFKIGLRVTLASLVALVLVILYLGFQRHKKV